MVSLYRIRPLRHRKVGPLRNHLLLIALLAAALAAPLAVADDCPFGQVNDRDPGKCGLYEDTDRDSVCDLSRKAAPTETARTVVATPVRAPASRVSPRNAGPVAIASTVPIAAPDPPDPAPVPARPSPLRQRYPLWQVFAAVFALAILTEALIRRNQRLVLPLQAVWNWALALSFLLTLASSLVFVYPALLSRMDFNVAYWHALTGLLMIAAGTYHTVRRCGCLWRGAGSWFCRRAKPCDRE